MLSPQLSQDPRRKKGEGSACNAGDPGLIPGSGRSAGEGIGLPIPMFLGFPCGSASKETVHNAGDLGWIPGLGRSPGEGKGYPLQCSGLEDSMDCTVHGVAESGVTERLSLTSLMCVYVYTTSSLSIPPSVDISVVATSWPS